MDLMLFLIVGIVGFVVLGTLMNALSSEETRVFRKYWISQVAVHSGTGDIIDTSQRSSKTLKALFQHFNIPNDNGQIDWGNQRTESKVAEMIVAAQEFDVKHPRNKGTRVVESLRWHLQMSKDRTSS